MRIGILSVQGAFIEHKQMLEAIAEKYEEPVECIELRQKKDLTSLDGLVLPGGESTVQGNRLSNDWYS